MFMQSGESCPKLQQVDDVTASNCPDCRDVRTRVERDVWRQRHVKDARAPQ